MKFHNRALGRALLAGAAAVLLAVPAHAALTISRGATTNVSCGGGTCTATAADAVLNVRDLKTALAAGDLTVSAGSDAADIVVADKFQWAKPHRLTLSAFHSVIFSAAVSVEGTGGVTVTPNAEGGAGGDLVFTDKGKLALWDLSSSLIIAGDSYTLVGDLDGLASAVAADPTGFYALARMFDAQGATYSKAAVTTVFSGKFTGLGHTIANVHIGFHNGDSGLFGQIGTHAVVRDLTLQNIAIAPTDSKLIGHAGTLAGRSAGQLTNITVLDSSVDIRSSHNKATAGGLVGGNSGTIAQSRVETTTLLGIRVGGMVGDNAGTITGSHADPTVKASSGRGNSGNTVAGGLVSDNTSTIQLSSAGGSIVAADSIKASGGDQYVGGLAAKNSGTIDRSFSTASVDGGNGDEGSGHSTGTHTGGLIGFSAGTVTDSYARGAVTAGGGGLTFNTVGGFVGEIQAGSMQATYSTGAVTCTCGAGQDRVGGYLGRGATVPTKSYWDTETSGQSAGCGDQSCTDVQGRTTAQLKSALQSGFNASVWALSAGINDGYPYLIDNPPVQ